MVIKVHRFPTPIAVKLQNRSSISPRRSMETQSQSKVYFHYNHTDSCKLSRWTSRESFQFMYNRPWDEVVDFYSGVVNGKIAFLDLFGTQIVSSADHYVPDDAKSREVPLKTELEQPSNEDKSGRWARVTFKIVLSYHGGSFDGWQKQPGLNTVQGLVEMALGRFVDEKKAQQLKEKCKPLEGCAVVAGRTDKGVSALQQVCSFYTWRNDIRPQEIEDAINSSAPGKLRVLSVTEVSRAFHPNFSAKWRRYMYIFPLKDGEGREQNFDTEDLQNLCSDDKFNSETSDFDVHLVEENADKSDTVGNGELEGVRKPKTFSVFRVNQLLQQLEGKLLSYRIYARDTKASRNVGPPTECFIYHARAMEARLPHAGGVDGRRVMCIELVANRFLRKMVRVLVATAVREAAAGAGDDALIKLMDASCRRASAPPAPPDGLCMVDVGYTEFDPQISIIL